MNTFLPGTHLSECDKNNILKSSKLGKMKKLIVVVILFVAFQNAWAQDSETLVIKKIEKRTVPAAVITSVEKEYPEGIVELWEAIPVKAFESYYVVSETNDMYIGEKPEYYQVTMKGTHSKTYAVYDANGNLIHSREIIKDTALPEAIRTTIVTDYPGWRITGDKEVIREGDGVHNTYKVELSKSKERRTLITDEEGQVLKDHKGKEAA